MQFYGSLLLIIIIGVAYLDLAVGGMGWMVALFGFLFGLILLVGLIASIVLFIISLSKSEPITLLKNKGLYWFILIFVIVFGIFARVMRATGNA